MPAPVFSAHGPASGLESLVWRGDRLAEPEAPGLPTGHSRLDAVLPGGGWPRGALTEFLLPHPGVGELGLLLPLKKQSTSAPTHGQNYTLTPAS